MQYGPDVALADIMSSNAAVQVLERYLPGILADPELVLSPYIALGGLPRLVRVSGEPLPDLTPMYRELAALTEQPAPLVMPEPPSAPSAHYESPQVRRASATASAPAAAEQWGLAELTINGPSHGNPFVDVALTATFRHDSEEVVAGGFYDGGGTYLVRFHPPAAGAWTFETQSNARSLDGLAGSVNVLPPSAGNRGRVIVQDTYHFAYQDGTPYLPLGTTAYAWTHQSKDIEESTLHTLAESSFTKLRMCVFPKSFVYNTKEPVRYPYERDADGAWDFSRFDVDFFRHLEERVRQLQDIGVEADIILFHPYDRWGFSQLPAWADQLYTKYVVRRLAAFRGVWWSLANEYDFMKSKTEDDWEGIADVIRREDHVGHLTSIHNGSVIYDHNRSWITHCSIQRPAENIEALRDTYRKPVVFDECGYEGDLEWRWGNLSPQELVRRSWEGAVRGSYVNHGETYHDDDEIIWWSQGGTLRGESAARFGFLSRIIAEVPSGRIEPLPSDFDAPWGGDEDHRLVYFGINRPARRTITLPPGSTWHVDIIDTWAMTVDTLLGTFEGRFTASLPEREYMAVRLRRADVPRNQRRTA